MLKVLSIAWLIWIGVAGLFTAPFFLTPRGRAALAADDWELGAMQAAHARWARLLIRGRLLIAAVTVLALVAVVFG